MCRVFLAHAVALSLVRCGVLTMENARDAFLSEEDLDLRNLSETELYAWWNLWLEQAQITNDLDQYTYSHGVFEVDPSAPKENDRSIPPPSWGRYA